MAHLVCRTSWTFVHFEVRRLTLCIKVASDMRKVWKEARKEEPLDYCLLFPIPVSLYNGGWNIESLLTLFTESKRSLSSSPLRRVWTHQIIQTYCEFHKLHACWRGTLWALFSSLNLLNLIGAYTNNTPLKMCKKDSGKFTPQKTGQDAPNGFMKTNTKKSEH